MSLLKSKIYSLPKTDKKEIKKAKYINKNIVDIIKHKEYRVW